MYTTCENRIKNSAKIEANTIPNPLKNDAHFDTNFRMEKITTCYRIWKPTRVQVDPKIDKTSMKNQQMQKS